MTRALSGPRAAGGTWIAALAGAAILPLLITTPYYLSTAITCLIFIGLAVAFDLVVGRIGALSLAQPVFLGFGAYAAAILSSRYHAPLALEVVISIVGAVGVALAIGIPSFRLSLHAFAIGTLGLAISAQLVAQNWVPVTGGPLCVTRILPIQLGPIVVEDLIGQYYVILAIAALSVLTVWWLARTRLGLAFTAVRDDPVLADARGLNPTYLRLVAFSISAVLSALVGLFVAHFQTVVCPDSMGFAYTVSLLIMVFIGGRGSLRGVVSAAVIFTALPQVLRLADEWRLAIFGLILLLTVTTFPDGLEHAYRSLGRLLTGGSRRAAPAAAEVRGASEGGHLR